MSSWLTDLLTRVDVFAHPDRWLAEPPAGTSMTDLKAVRGLLDPLGNGTVSPIMLAMELRLQTLGNGKQPAPLTLPLNHSPAVVAQRFASRCLNGARKEDAGEVIEEMLDAVHKAIAARLDAGERHPEVIPSADFGEDGLTHICIDALAGPEHLPGMWMSIGYLDKLPADHSLRNHWPVPYLHGTTRRPAVVLGRRDRPWLGLGGGPGTARTFHLLPEVDWWTARLLSEQLKALRGKPFDQVRPDEVERLHQAEGTVTLPRRRPQPAAPSSPSPEGLTWRERVELVCKVLQANGGGFTLPPATTPIADLLDARRAFDVRDHNMLPHKDAARNFAARWAGQGRQTTLSDLLTPVIAKVNSAIAAALERGAEWAAEQAAEQSLNGDGNGKADELAALQAQVQALTRRIAELEARPPATRPTNSRRN